MTTAEDTLVGEWTRWHDQREQVLREPHGWLSLTALHWLSERPQRFDGVPGLWSTSDQVARVSATTQEHLVVDGRPLDGTAEVIVEEAASSLFAGFGEVRVEVILRTGRYGIRVRDPRAPARVSFTGVPAFEVREEWVVPATFEPYPAATEVVVGGAQEGLRHVLRAVGELRFTIGGVAQSLVATARGEGGLMVSFSDATSGDTTASWRTLTTAAPERGHVTLDFNRAVNLPYAFSTWGTCPQPPAGNVISVAVEAGEKTPASGEVAN